MKKITTQNVLELLNQLTGEQFVINNCNPNLIEALSNDTFQKWDFEIIDGIIKEVFDNPADYWEYEFENFESFTERLVDCFV